MQSIDIVDLNGKTLMGTENWRKANITSMYLEAKRKQCGSASFIFILFYEFHFMLPEKHRFTVVARDVSITLNKNVSFSMQTMGIFDWICA